MMKKKTTRTESNITRAYALAKEAYAAQKINTDAVIQRALHVPISLHCWQADDVAGLETKSGAVDSGGIMATGNYPGRARNGDEMRQDLDKVMSMLPGRQRVNVHAFYAETGSKIVGRDELEPRHFKHWIDWARAGRFGLDFNPTYFAHPNAAEGMTLSHPSRTIRDFWIRHGVAARRIAAHMGHALKSPCVNNHWVPDGMKDSPADRWGPRARLADSYDRIFGTKIAHAGQCVDAVESKLFGIGSEDFVVGSMEFYTSYALSRGVVQCLDMGHYHPTEGIHDKISALLQFQEKLLIHTSRPVRWDSDHVVLFNDDVRQVFLEIARGKALDRVYVALDFFDASINRIAAYVIGARATRLAILSALLDPSAHLRELELKGRRAEKLACMEAQKTMPLGAVWDMLCLRAGVAPASRWLEDVAAYEANVLSAR